MGKPKQFADQFSQCEKTVFKDSEVQAEVGDPLWVAPKDFRDAWVQKDMDPHESQQNVSKSIFEGSSVAPQTSVAPQAAVAPPAHKTEVKEAATASITVKTEKAEKKTTEGKVEPKVEESKNEQQPSKAKT